MVEKAGEIVAHFKCTIAVLPRSTVILAGDLPFAKERFNSEKTIQNKEIQDLLASSLWKKEEKKKPSKKEEGKAE